MCPCFHFTHFISFFILRISSHERNQENSASEINNSSLLHKSGTGISGFSCLLIGNLTAVPELIKFRHQSASNRTGPSQKSLCAHNAALPVWPPPRSLQRGKWFFHFRRVEASDPGRTQSRIVDSEH